MPVRPLDLMRFTCGCSRRPSKDAPRICIDEALNSLSVVSARSPEVNPVSGNFVPVLVSQHEEVCVTIHNPGRCLSSRLPISEELFRIIVCSNVNAGRYRRLPGNVVVRSNMDTAGTVATATAVVVD